MLTVITISHSLTNSHFCTFLSQEVSEKRERAKRTLRERVSLRRSVSTEKQSCVAIQREREREKHTHTWGKKASERRRQKQQSQQAK